MRKIIALLFVFVIVISACSDDTSESEAVNLTWYTVGTPPADGELVNDEINEYLSSVGADYTVDIIYFDWSEYDQKMSVKLNAGEPIDIMFSASYAANYTQYASEGYFYDLSEFEDTILKDTFDTISPILVEGATVNGGIYGVPANKEVGWDQYWVWDAELVEKYDVPVDDIKTMEDAIPYIKEVSENEPDFVSYPIDMDQKNPQLNFNSLDCVANTKICFDLDNPDAGYELQLENEGTRQVLEDLHTIQQAGYAGSGYETKKFDATTEHAFLQILAGFPTVETQWSVQRGRDVITVPVMETPYATTSSTTGSLNVVSANSAYPEQSAEFLNLMNTDSELRNLMAFGIEGTHYDLNDNDKVVKTETGISNYNTPTFAQGNFFILDLQEGEPDNKWELMEERNDVTRMSPTLGFTPDLSEYDAELAALATVEEQYLVSVMMGEAEDFEGTLQEYIDASYDAGAQEIIDEVNKQYSEWLEEQ